MIPEYEEENTRDLESTENFQNQRINASGIEFKMETEYLDSNVSDHLQTPPKNPSIVKHRPQDSPAEARALQTILIDKNLSADQALRMQQLDKQQPLLESLPPMIQNHRHAMNPQLVSNYQDRRIMQFHPMQPSRQFVRPLTCNPQYIVNPHAGYPYAPPFGGYQPVNQQAGFHYNLPQPAPMMNSPNPLSNFYSQGRASRVTHSRSVSISAGGRKVMRHESTEAVEMICKATITVDEIDTIPLQLLQSVLEANVARLGRFCSEQYVYDPRSNPMTSQICYIIQKIQHKLGSV